MIEFRSLPCKNIHIACAAQQLKAVCQVWTLVMTHTQQLTLVVVDETINWKRGV